MKYSSLQTRRPSSLFGSEQRITSSEYGSSSRSSLSVSIPLSSPSSFPGTPSPSIPPLLHLIYLKKFTQNKYLVDILSFHEKQSLISYTKHLQSFLAPPNSEFLNSDNFRQIIDSTKLLIHTFPKESPPPSSSSPSSLLPSHSFLLVILMLLKSVTPSENLKYATLEHFLECYEEFQSRSEQEKRYLFETANWMNILFQFIPAKVSPSRAQPPPLTPPCLSQKNKGLVLDVIPKLIEGFEAIYITGSGQTKQTADRVKIYETEGGITPTKRFKWKASDYHSHQLQQGSHSSPQRKVNKRRTVSKKESLSVLVKNPVPRNAITPIRGMPLDEITSVSFPSTSPPATPFGPCFQSTDPSLSADLPAELPGLDPLAPRSETEVLYETYWSTDIAGTSVAAVLSEKLPTPSPLATPHPFPHSPSPTKPVALDVSSWRSCSLPDDGWHGCSDPSDSIATLSEFDTDSDHSSHYHSSW
jgi:hypothetical protein